MRSQDAALAGLVLTGLFVAFLSLSALSLLTGASSTRTERYEGDDLDRSGVDLFLNISAGALSSPVVMIGSERPSGVQVRVEVRSYGDVRLEEREGRTPLTMVLPDTSHGSYGLIINILTDGAGPSDLYIEVRTTDLLAMGISCLLSCFIFAFVPLFWASGLTFLVVAAFMRRKEARPFKADRSFSPPLGPRVHFGTGPTEKEGGM